MANASGQAMNCGLILVFIRASNKDGFEVGRIEVTLQDNTHTSPS